jgi:Flp pilus assembly CpaE family ATPase
VRVVVNRANSGIQHEALEAALECQIAATVVSAGRFVVSAANEGKPIVEQDAASEQQVTRDLHRLAALVVGRPFPSASRKSKGMFAWSRRADR